MGVRDSTSSASPEFSGASRPDSSGARTKAISVLESRGTLCDPVEAKTFSHTPDRGSSCSVGSVYYAAAVWKTGLASSAHWRVATPAFPIPVYLRVRS